MDFGLSVVELWGELEGELEEEDSCEIFLSASSMSCSSFIDLASSCALNRLASSSSSTIIDRKSSLMAAFCLIRSSFSCGLRCWLRWCLKRLCMLIMRTRLMRAAPIAMSQ